MRDVDVVHGDPKQAGRLLAHQAPRDVHGEFVRAGDGEGVGFEVVDRELEDHLQLLQFKFAARQLRGVERGFVVVVEQMVVVGGCCRTWRRSSRCLGSTTRAPKPWPKERESLSPMRLKPLLGATTQASDGGRLRSLRKYSKTVGMIGRDGGKVVEGLVDAGGQAGGGDIVAQDSLVHDLGEEAALGARSWIR